MDAPILYLVVSAILGLVFIAIWQAIRNGDEDVEGSDSSLPSPDDDFPPSYHD